MTEEQRAQLRTLPAVDTLAKQLDDVPDRIAVLAARQAIAVARQAIVAGESPPSELPPLAKAWAHRLELGRMKPVINATGIVVHTNLGRAPWSDSARAAALRASRYCDLEMKLESGLRGGRLSGAAAQLRLLTGAEAAIVVNNCAAAVLLALTALARDRDVIVSRGELVEIGGSFRVPDVIASGGARLKEVGTTNRTRASDVEAAIDDHVAVILRVHPSNFRITGFTEAPDRKALVDVARRNGVVLVEDLGSGCFDAALGDEPVPDVIAEGVDVVCFSGDKLLGGPQAGILAGRAEVIERLRRHPLYRALRVDKVILAALEATLGDHLAGRAPPVAGMTLAEPHVLQTRAQALHRALGEAGVETTIVEDVGYVGGGARPMEPIAAVVVQWQPKRPDRVARALRTGTPAIVARVSNDAVLFDVRTLRDDDLPALAARVAELA
ncbi:MAG: L-seryl-tRNA(Sec) selenium transferase [Myxococcota bacterium]